MQHLFGTDGIRGTPGEYPLDDAMLRTIGAGVARRILQSHAGGGSQPTVIIGKDTRLSGAKLEEILCDALTGSGISVAIAGIITTPGLSLLVKEKAASMGIMISASHNKPTDNGIKFFNANGYKLLPAEERQLEDIILGNISSVAQESNNRQRGSVSTVSDASVCYISFLQSTMQGQRLQGLTVALDCAWGATSLYARQLFESLGATVYTIHDLPNGEHINKGGTMDPSFLKDFIERKHADIGCAFDGDGDRGIIIDEKGSLLDGDYILAILGRHLIQRNILPRNTLVTTVMANIGLTIALQQAGGHIKFAQVGDKHVLETLLENKLTVGGEQSGHIIFLDYLPTPDGMVTALQILKIMKQTGKPLSELARCMQKFPQTLLNVKVRERRPFEAMPSVSRMVELFTKQLKGEGRILLRYSGTEPLARVMVEGKDKDMIEDISRSLARVIQEEIGFAEQQL